MDILDIWFSLKLYHVFSNGNFHHSFPEISKSIYSTSCCQVIFPINNSNINSFKYLSFETSLYPVNCPCVINNTIISFTVHPQPFMFLGNIISILKQAASFWVIIKCQIYFTKLLGNWWFPNCFATAAIC